MMAKVYEKLEGELEGDFFLHTTMSDEQRQVRSDWSGSVTVVRLE
jgi:hypothetical protein